jgi:hypothetical protein
VTGLAAGVGNIAPRRILLSSLVGPGAEAPFSISTGGDWSACHVSPDERCTPDWPSRKPRAHCVLLSCRSVDPDVDPVVVQSFLAAITAVRSRSEAIVELFGQGPSVTDKDLADSKTNVSVTCVPVVLSLEGPSGKRVSIALLICLNEPESRACDSPRGVGCQPVDRA